MDETDLDFILAQLLPPGNDPSNDPFGSILSPFGIRDVQGVGNNVLNPTWGAADQIFPRLTTATTITGEEMIHLLRSVTERIAQSMRRGSSPAPSSAVRVEKPVTQRCLQKCSERRCGTGVAMSWSVLR